MTVRQPEGMSYTTLRRKQLDENDVGLILWSVEAGQHPEWKDITVDSLTHKSYWAQWNSLVVRDGVLELNGSQPMSSSRQDEGSRYLLIQLHRIPGRTPPLTIQPR
jgi:hypothetical protein